MRHLVTNNHRVEERQKPSGNSRSHPQKKEDEDAFFKTVGRLLKTGMKAGEIMIMMDDDMQYNDDQRVIFKEWVKGAVLHHKQGRQLLAEQTPPKAGPTPITGNT